MEHERTQKSNSKKLVFLVLALFIISLNLASAISVTNLNNQNIIIPNSTYPLNFNLTTDYLKDLTHTFNGSSFNYIDGLVLAYNFDNRSALSENDLTVVDISGNGNNATVLNKTSVTGILTNDGRYNKGFMFDGNNGSLVGNSAGITTNGIYPLNFSTQNSTVSIWFYPRNYLHSDVGGILSFWGFNQFRWKSTDSTCRFNVWNGSDVSPAIVSCPANEWHQMVATNVWNGSDSNYTVYVDGVLRQSKVFNKYLLKSTDTTTGLQIGRSVWGGASNGWHTFNGTIDELMIFNKTLSSLEIYNLYKSQLTKHDTQNWSFVYNVNNSVYLQSSNLSISNLTSTISTSNTIRQLNTINALYSVSLGNVRNDFYGVALAGQRWFGAEIIDANNDGVREATSNTTWHKQYYSSSKIGLGRLDANMQYFYSNTSNSNGVNYTGDLTDLTNHVQYLLSLNNQILVTLDFMPSWLADNSSGKCIDLTRCPPTNATKLANIFLDEMSRIGCTPSICQIEVWNEPYLSFWMGGLATDHITKALNYTKMYDTLYNVIKANNSAWQIGGPSGYRYAPNMTNTFLTNESGKFDFISIHPYESDSTKMYTQLNDINDLYRNCTAFGVSCNRIIMSEWNTGGALMQNTSSLSSKYSVYLATSYISILNNYPTNVSSVIHQWASRYHYGAYDPDYSSKYTMVSEPQLDNAINPPYNITYQMTRYCGAGQTITVTSNDGDDSCLQQIACTTPNGATKSLTIINTCNYAKNVSTNLDENILNVKSGTIYQSGSVNLGVLEPYDVKFYTEPITTHPTYYNYLGEDLGFENPYYTGSQAQLTDSQDQFCSNGIVSITEVFSRIPLVFWILGVIFVLGFVLVLISQLGIINGNKVDLGNAVDFISEINIPLVIMVIMILGFFGIVAIMGIGLLCGLN